MPSCRYLSLSRSPVVNGTVCNDLESENRLCWMVFSDPLEVFSEESPEFGGLDVSNNGEDGAVDSLGGSFGLYAPESMERQIILGRI
jgi:hypothetical protein